MKPQINLHAASFYNTFVYMLNKRANTHEFNIITNSMQATTMIPIVMADSDIVLTDEYTIGIRRTRYLKHTTGFRIMFSTLLNSM